MNGETPVLFDWRRFGFHAAARLGAPAMSGHAHHHDDFSRAFALGIALNVAIVLVEAVYGVLANSMALIADAGHNLSDVLGLIVGLAGTVMAKRSPSARFTYGLEKASILAALVN